jgi:acetyl-CoA C-acetyltransferase
MDTTYFIAGTRTPFLKAGTAFAKETPLTLSALVLRAMACETRPDLIVWGQVIPSPTYSNIAREASLDAGLDASIPSYSTQLACSTSMAGAIQAAGMLGRGGIDVALIGGVEQMGRARVSLTDDASARLVALGQTDPARLPAAFSALNADDLTLPNGGWSNRISGRTMGDHMEETAKSLNISRVAQDDIAFQSHRNAARARDNGFFDDLILPYGDVRYDSFIRADTSLGKLADLKPVFDHAAGSLTAGNSSPLTDGAAGLWVVNGTGRQRLGKDLPALKLVDFELGAVDFQKDGMLMAPAYAIPRLLARHGLRFEDIDLWEIHEAFAAQVLANILVASSSEHRARYSPDIGDLGKFPWDRLNPHGGSLALGHPFGATGARILSQTCKALAAKPKGTRAIVSICADGGQGSVLLVERA